MDFSEYLLLGHNFPNFPSWIALAVRTKFQIFFLGLAATALYLKT